MAWRFKASKYKNAAPIVPKPEQCIRDICVGSYQTYGNNIAASAAFMAFNWEHVGSSLAVLPIDDCGRKSKTMPLLHGHTDTVTDLEFSPFHDGLLATGSQDCLVKIWHIPEKGLETSLTEPECTFHHKQRRVERVGFHPTADCLMHSASAGNVSLWDITTQQEAFSNNQHPEVIQSLSWRLDGSVLATTCKDKMVRIIDPRATEAPIAMMADNHASIKDSRVVWLGQQNRILTTGFDAARLRQVIIRDLRNFGTPEKTLELDCSTGILMPLYDPDTNMLFLAGKGDITITYLEVTDKEPYFVEGLRHSGEQTKGACLVPKRALRVMEGEVNRVLQLTSNTVIPIMYQVPRKTYRDFHGDLYPETNGCKTDLTAAQWLGGANVPVAKISLDPAKRELGEQPIVILRGNLQEVVKNLQNKPSKLPPTAKQHQPNEDVKPKQFVPIKDKIKQMEETNLKAGIEKNEFELKFKEVTAASHKDQKNNENESLLIESVTALSTPGTENGSGNGSFEMENNELDGMEMNDRHQNGNGVAPKPLPRTSRTNSVTGDSFEDMLPPSSILPSVRPVPVARPRTTASSYKPRLGPKPFSSGTSGEFSFDKVFSVPQVPGQEDSNRETVAMESDSPPASFSPVKEKSEEEKVTEAVEHTNGKDNGHDEEVELRQKETDEALDTVEKIRTTAERRRLFESRNEAEDAFDSADDKNDQFDRQNGQRNSIADRRRMYESRSLSVQEEKPASPTIKRRDSLNKRDNKEDETKRNSIPFELVRRKSDLTKESLADTNRSKKTTDTANTTASKRTSTVFGKVSKFRHLKGTTGHKSTQLENLRNLSRQIPGECDGFHANHERVAVPLSGPGGKIAIYELSKPGRLPDGVIPSLVNGSNIMDFQWDPFDVQRLAVACDDGVVKLWKVPEGGLTEPTNSPEAELTAHLDKIYIIKFHPLAENVLLTASYDMTIKVWDLDTLSEKLCLTGHTDQIFSLCWSPCGQYIATVCKDGKVRVYNPRKSNTPIREGPGPVGTRGARIVWAIEGEYLVVTGFDKVSERQISVYKSNDLHKPLGTVGLDVSPAILIPFYDEDSSTLFLTGKGDTTIYAYEISEEPPYCNPLSHHRCTSLHQGLSFLAKNQCDVTIVEFAKALRLTNSTVEPLSFTVPRLKNELFQDDLFPPTRVLWQPTMGSLDWFAAKDKKAKKISLQPEGMESLSSTQPTPTPVKKIDPIVNNRLWDKDTIKAKQNDIQKSVSARLEVNYKLEQDDMEGVAENEWEE